MKRILCSVIALIMLLSIVPCFAESDITIKLFRSGQGMPAADEDVILPGIKEALGCDVEWVVVSAEYQTQLGARLAGGDIPDLFQMDYIMAPIYAQQGLLLDLAGRSVQPDFRRPGQGSQHHRQGRRAGLCRSG